MKKVKPFGLLIKYVSQTMKMKQKNKKEDFSEC